MKLDNVVFITYWWGGDTICDNTKYDYFQSIRENPKTYKELANMWVKQMKQFKLHFYIEKHTEFENSYQEGISYKPMFIMKCIQKFKRPIVYMDIDLRMHKKPFIFGNNYFDFIAINWNTDIRAVKEIDFYTFETCGFLMYFNNTHASMKLLEKWNTMFEDANNKGKADDRLLAICFHQNNFLKDIKCYWLPMEYYYVPQYYKNKVKQDQVVISHPYAITSEEDAEKMGASEDRVPVIYDKIIKSKSQKNMKEFFHYYFKDVKEKQHYKTLNTLLCKYKKKYIVNHTQSTEFENKLVMNHPMTPKMLLKKIEMNKYAIYSIKEYVKQSYYDIIFDKKMNILYLRVNTLTMELLKTFPKYKHNISILLGLRISL